MTTLPAWLDTKGYPFTPRRFATPDGELSYVDVGKGPAVLLVHGTPSWSYEFREVVRELSRDHRCIAVDHLGFGLSDKRANAPLRLEDHGRRLRALVEGLGLRDLILVMHDFGGPIALPLALDDDGLVRGLVVLNSWMWPSDGDPAVARIDRVVRSWLGRLLYRRLAFPVRVVMPSAFANRRRLTKAIHRQYLAPLSSALAREGTYAMALALKGADPLYASLWDRRGGLATTPTVIVWGMRDPIIAPKYLDRWTCALPHARVVRLDDAGHFVAEERPDAVAEAVRSLR
jgi:pimeloyl-ACP methyl ester carboxylesterase